MISLKIAEMNRFMTKLLKGNEFDTLLLQEGFMRTAIEYRFSGRLFTEYFDTEEKEQRKEGYAAWAEIKPLVFELVKGKKTPLAFSFTLLLPETETKDFIEKYHIPMMGEKVSLYLQIRFEHGTGKVVTGTARTRFALDRSLEEAWDAEAEERFRRMEIAMERE